MKPKKFLLALSLLCVPVLSTCGGGGGGGAVIVNNTPSLLAVSFAGSAASPVAGDKLRLLMSEAVSLSGASLDGSDLVISGGGSLGTLTAAPVVLNSIVVEITLGAGVDLTVGSTTVDFSSANDAVQDAHGLVAVASTAKTLTKADLDVPVINDLTVANVHRLLNGSGAAGGVLQAATTGFAINARVSDTSAISAGLSVISSNQTVQVHGLSIAAGENLAGDLTATTGSGTIAFAVPAAVRFPDGAHTLTVRLADVTGQVSQPANFSFLAKTLTAANRPFENGQTWFLDTSRDLESYTLSPASATAAAPVLVVDGASGRSDLEDLFRILGLQSGAPLPNVSGSKDSNEVVMDLFEDRLLTDLSSFFSSVNITFTFTSPGSFPSSTTVPYASHPFSQICIAGAHEVGGTTGVLGLAIFDKQNQSQVNDCEEDFKGSRLGVFLHTLITTGEQSSQSTQFRVTYDPFTPARSGSPIGAAGDAAALVAMLNNNTPSGARGLKIQRAIEDLARFTALVLAHECGHSMGLVEDGAMPTGLYGGDSVNFPSSTSGHIKMPDSVFSGGSLNIMTPAIGYIGGVDGSSKFNSLNLAYLREQVVHN
ncbi:MAG: hypothetical protein VX951_09905 [Planctomycetota bacterium]|nr:hypothetical protein [Planctomycetota bacterium]